MRAVARDLDRSLRIFATLAAVCFVIGYGAPASWMRTFCVVGLCHELSFRLNNAPAATNQVEHQNHRRYDQQQMDQATADAHGESKKPQNQ
jgi:hypothetical protein